MAARRLKAKRERHVGRQFRISREQFASLLNGRTAYDAAATNKYNENHWKQATSQDADSALLYSGELATIRERCRHEIRNNTYAAGIGRKFSHYAIGTGPTLQVQTENETLNDAIERMWQSWADNCDDTGVLSYAEMLHLGVRELFPAGEYFRIFQGRRGSSSGSVSLRLLCVEAERVTDPYSKAGNQDIRDGIEFNAFGRRYRYWIAKHNPGSQYYTQSLSDSEFDVVDASRVVHFSMTDRPEQVRGCPLMAQSVEVFAKTRRWDEATLAAAERAALFGIILVTNSEMMLGDNPSVRDHEEWELSSGMGVIAPPGYDAKQVSPDHPGAQYEVFRKAKIQECGAAVDMPYNILASDSSAHSYASGRLDWQGLTRSVKVLRSWIERRDCAPTFRAWWEEAHALNLVPGAPEDVPIVWRWPGFEHVDPSKEANAAETRLRMGLLTYADYYAEQGKDWRQEFRQRAKEKAEMKALDIEPEDLKPAPRPVVNPAPGGANEE